MDRKREVAAVFGYAGGDRPRFFQRLERAANVQRLAVVAEFEFVRALRRIDAGQKPLRVAEIRMRREAQRLAVVGRAIYELREMLGRHAVQRASGFFDFFPQLGEIGRWNDFPKGVFHAQAIDVEQKHGAGQFAIGRISRDDRAADTLAPQAFGNQAGSDRPAIGRL